LATVRPILRQRQHIVAGIEDGAQRAAIRCAEVTS
jgi:hypothetical protein